MVTGWDKNSFYLQGNNQYCQRPWRKFISYPIDAWDLRWSPDGKKIAFIGTETLDQNLGQALDIEGGILSTAAFIMDANETNITRLTKSNEESIKWFTWISIENIK